MGELAIVASEVSKCFKRYRHPVDRLKELLFPRKQRAQEFWALRNINVEVHRGETLGIVGRNGSGKSTLLQIVVGTLTPTAGRVAVGGRISALLELGSGFNMEFTGRQNVFFNGQILGLTTKEIEERFDDIVAFADIGDFIDQPVKTYSSGMFVRLGFAVATSVDPDILVVDEALSVGDEAFQRKCFARIQDLRERNRTILFVSHSASSILELCDRAALLDRGELLICDRPKTVLDAYHRLLYAPADRAAAIRLEILKIPKSRPGVGDALPQGNGISSTTSHNFVSNVPPHSRSISQPAENGSAPKMAPEVAGGGEARGERGVAPREFFDPNLVPSSTVTYISRGARISQPRIVTLNGKPVNHLIARREYFYTYRVSLQKRAESLRFGMLIKTVSGLEMGGCSFVAASQGIREAEAGTQFCLKFRFCCLLNPGTYFLNAGVSGTTDGVFSYLDRHVDAAMFKVLPEPGSANSGTIDFLIQPQLSFVDRPQHTGTDGADAEIEAI